MMGFKIITWNINGLRSFGGPQQFRPAIFEKFDGQPDMVCLQETKLSRTYNGYGLLNKLNQNYFFLP